VGQVSLSGVLTAGPTGSGDAVFPAATFQAPLGLLGGSAKQYGVATGILTRNLQSPSAFVTLDGVGTAATVTQGSFLYFKTDGAIDLRITTDDGSGGQDVVVVPVQGLLVMELPTNKPLELLEAQGSGKLEYLVAGSS